MEEEVKVEAPVEASEEVLAVEESSVASSEEATEESVA